MKTQVLPNNLKDALKWVKPGISNKSVLPVLHNVLVEATLQGVRLTATNLELSASAFIGSKTEKPGKTTVSFLALETLAKKLPDISLEMETKKNGHLALTQDSRSISLDTIDPQEFPLTPTANGKTYTALDDLLDACRFVQHAIGTEDYGRPALTYAQIKKGKMYAADGYRLAIAPTFNAEASLPRSLVNFLARMKEEPTKLTLDDKFVTVWFGDNWVSATQGEGKFPDWEQIIPKPDWSIKVDFGEFLDKVQLIASLKPDANMVKLQPKKGRLYLEANTEDAAITDWLPASCEGNRDLFALNIRYLMDALLARKPFVKEGWLQLKGQGVSSPVMFFDQHTRLVEAVMPMHISK